VIHYRSLQPYTRPISVAVAVDGVAGIAATSYTSPAAPPLAGPGPGPRAGASKPFWESSLALVLAASVGGLLLGLSLLIVLVPLVRRTGVRARIGDFVTDPNAYGPQLSAELAAARVAGRTERALERSPWWARFKEEVEISRIPRTPIEIVQITAAGTLVAAVLLSVLVGSPLVILAVLVIGPLIMRAVVSQRLAAQRRLFGDQLSGHLQEVASAMRSGHSMVGAFRVMAESASEPTHGEFRRVLADEELGMPLDDAMLPIVRRMASTDIEQVALIISLHRRAGGNVAEVLDRVASSVRERAELRRELHSLTAQARLSRWVVTALPPAILLFLAVANPAYIRPLFNTPAGVVLLVIAGAMVVLGSLVMRKLVDIEP
jgi:tight adherence protein B